MRRLRFLTGGESHGPRLTAILEGLPAGLPLDRDAMDWWLSRRQHGFGRGGRQRIESDRVEVTGGLRGGRTTGGPLVLHVQNRDWENWAPVMDPWELDAEAAAGRRVTAPRPGHADLSGGLGTGQTADLRNVLERASARETAVRVAAGAVCAQFLSRYGITLRSGVLQLGPHALQQGPPDWEILGRVDPASPLVSVDPTREEKLVTFIREVRQRGETLGGVVGAAVRGLPPGLGSHVHWDRKLDGRLARALVSIPSVKAVAIGAGIEAAALEGSSVHDPILPGPHGLKRPSNRAGGLEGGVTNGADLIVRAWFKPISTLRRGLPSVDLETGAARTTDWERSDTVAVASAPVIVEAMLALILADALLETLGGNCMDDVDAAWRAYTERLAPWWRPEAVP